MIKEDVNSSIDPEASSALTKEREDNAREEDQKLPVSGTAKWEKARSSARVSKKPDIWGHDVMDKNRSVKC